MNKDNAHLFLPLVQALAEGKTIQGLGSAGQWLDISNPMFGGDPSDYRIKPEPVFDWAIESFPTGRKDGDWQQAGTHYAATEQNMKRMMEQWTASGTYKYDYRARKLAPVEEALT